MSRERSFDTMHLVIDAVLEADDIDDAVAEIARVLGAQHSLWQVGIEVFTLDFTTKLIAHWSPVDSFFTVGLEVAIDITEDARQTSSDVLLGKPLICLPEELSLGMYGDMLAAESVRAQMMVGLHDQSGVVVARLVLGSTSPKGFTEADIPFFTGLGRGLEITLLSLANAAT